MIESENCMSSPITVLNDCSVLGSAVFSGKPNENRSHSAPSRSTPILVRGVNTNRRFESISSKSLTCLPPRSTLPSPTYVPSATYSPDRGQNELLPSSENAGVAKKIGADNSKIRNRSANIFTGLPSTAVPPKQGNGFADVFHHH